MLVPGRTDPTVRRIALLPLASLLLAAPAFAQAGRPTSNRPVQELYVQNCQMCHMPDGNAAIKDRNFADGVPGTAMMAFKDRLSDAEILALVKYVRNFDKKLAAKPAAKSKAPAPKAGTK